MKMLIPAIPADDEANRAHAERLGQDWGPWPAPPAGSAPMRCENCQGAVMLDPETDEMRQELINREYTRLSFSA